MQQSSVSDAKRYAGPNVVSNLISVAATAAISLWLTAYLIAELGVAVYSIVPLAVSIGAYFSVLTRLITTSSGRYVAIHYSRGEMTRCNVYVNSAFFGLAYIALLLTIPVLVISFPGMRLLAVPAGFRFDASLLMVSVLLSLLISAAGSTLAVATFVTHRFYWQRAADLLGRAVQVAVILLLFSVAGTQLAFVGLGYLAMAVFGLAAYYVIARRLTPALKLDPRQFDRSAAREVCGTGAWLVLDRIGTLMYLNTDLLIINVLLGPDAGGRYAPLLQWVLLLRLLAPALGDVFSPVAIEHIARGKLRELRDSLLQAIRLMGIGIALPAGLICGFATPLLRVWLGPAFAELAPLLVLLVAGQMLVLPLNPIYNVNRGLNRVKAPALVTLALGVANVVLSVILAGPLGLGILGVATATVVCFTVRTTVVIAIYTARQIGMSGATLLRPMWRGLVLWGAVTALGGAISERVVLDSWLELGTASLGLGLCAATTAAFVLTTNDRRLIMDVLRHGSKTRPAA